jgi:hypothetical protein
MLTTCDQYSWECWEPNSGREEGRRITNSDRDRDRGMGRVTRRCGDGWITAERISLESPVSIAFETKPTKGFHGFSSNSQSLLKMTLPLRTHESKGGATWEDWRGAEIYRRREGSGQEERRRTAKRLLGSSGWMPWTRNRGVIESDGWGEGGGGGGGERGHVTQVRHGEVRNLRDLWASCEVLERERSGDKYEE